MGSLKMALGGTACTFNKEIKPYEKYEVWTRVLCWDQKWLYLISHFVKPGVVRSQPSSGSGKLENELNSLDNNPRNIIFASSIAKYVFKRGRMTVAPRNAFELSGLLPSAQSAMGEQMSFLPPQSGTGGEVYAPLDGQSDASNKLTNCKWTLVQVEEHNRQGLKIAQHFAELASLHQVFNSSLALSETPLQMK
ncbi:hypothetical protein B7463_g7702, partial [Scytalidium lignicola]